METLNKCLKSKFINKNRVFKNKISTIPVNLDFELLKIEEIIKTLETQHNCKYEYTPEIENIIKLLLLYFTGHEKFESEYRQQMGKTGSLNKGICLVGGVGVGKTMLFEIFKIYTSQMRKNSFQTFTPQIIKTGLQAEGREYFNKFSDNFNNQKMAKPISCYIEDVGSGNEIVKYFGSTMHSIRDFFEVRYQTFIRHQKLTHFDTNLYPIDLKELYGERITDRMKEMFNILELKGKSFRK